MPAPTDGPKAPQFFQGQPTIAEAVIDGGHLRVVRERLQPSQYLNLGRLD
jgi:ribosomal 50S subunit-recycling heat shock protein